MKKRTAFALGVSVRVASGEGEGEGRKEHVRASRLEEKEEG
jgi:hypothetical protein